MAFNFGQTTSGASSSGATGSSLFGTSGASGGLFGGSSGTTGFGFGSSSTPSSSSGGTLGGEAKTTTSGPGNTLFGTVSGTSITPQQQPFGGAGTQFSFGNFGASKPGTPSGTSAPTAAATSAPSLFGGTSTGGLFGGAGASGQTPNKPLFGALGSTTPVNTPPAGGSQSTNLFGSLAGQASGQQGASTSKPLFGSTPTTSAQASTTPQTGGFNFLGAGAKSSAPASAPTSTPSLFGGGASTSTPSTGGVFGGVVATTSAPRGGLFSSGAATTSAPSSGGLFGCAPVMTSAPGGSLFGGTPASAPSSGSFSGGAQPASGGSSLFGGFGKPTATSSQASIPTTTAATPASGGLFGSLGGAQQPSSGPFSKPATSPAPQQQPSFSLTAPTPTATQSTSPSSQATTTTSGPSLLGTAPAANSGLFGGLKPGSASASASSGAATSSAPASSAPSGGLFASLGRPAGASSAADSTSTTTAAPTPSLLGSLGDAASSSAAPASSTTATAGPAVGPSLSASATGPVPPAASRLKNKSMDEILTRWASDLANYQKEFQKQAGQISAWDRLLVENTEKISKLHTKTFQAERDAGEVERQLTIVENQQEELEAWLDKYEREVDDMVQKAGLGQDAGGVDLERERTYKLAEKLTERLDSTNKDLEDIILEINHVSSQLSKTKGPDDHLSNIVRVLNSHLQQLQAIDMNTSALKTRVAAAKKEQRAGGANRWHAIGTDPAEDFYKSYMSRR